MPGTKAKKRATKKKSAKKKSAPKKKAAKKRSPRKKAPKPPELRSSEVVEISRLKPHPRNYKTHPEDQLEHIRASLRTFGFYRNVVVANDYTILSGHGVVLAATAEKMTKVHVVRMDFGPMDPRALKILALENTVGQFGETNDRELAELLKELHEADELMGTGFDGQMLAALAMVTRDASEIADMDEAGEWAGAGMPEFEPEKERTTLVLAFDDEAGRDELVKKLKVTITKKQSKGKVWTAWWPPRKREDLSSVRFE